MSTAAKSIKQMPAQSASIEIYGSIALLVFW